MRKLAQKISLDHSVKLFLVYLLVYGAFYALLFPGSWAQKVAIPHMNDLIASFIMISISCLLCFFVSGKRAFRETACQQLLAL